MSHIYHEKFNKSVHTLTKILQLLYLMASFIYLHFRINVILFCGLSMIYTLNLTSIYSF